MIEETIASAALAMIMDWVTHAVNGPLLTNRAHRVFPAGHIELSLADLCLTAVLCCRLRGQRAIPSAVH
jgi:hypothetical protein